MTVNVKSFQVLLYKSSQDYAEKLELTTPSTMELRQAAGHSMSKKWVDEKLLELSSPNAFTSRFTSVPQSDHMALFHRLRIT